MFFCEPPLKNWVFQGTPILLKFFIFNPIPETHILKVTKFLVKTFQFQFLVMTEKNVFVYKLFLSFNILYFSSLFMLKLQPPLLWKKSPPSLREIPPFFENLVGGSTPHPSRKSGVHTMVTLTLLCLIGGGSHTPTPPDN